VSLELKHDCFADVKVRDGDDRQHQSLKSLRSRRTAFEIAEKLGLLAVGGTADNVPQMRSAPNSFELRDARTALPQNCSWTRYDFPSVV